MMSQPTDEATAPTAAPVTTPAPAPAPVASTTPAPTTDAVSTPAAPETPDPAPAHAPSLVSSVGSSVIEAATGPGEADEFDPVEGYETSNSIGSTSAASSIYAHTYEHGRRYHSFKNSRYPLPDDDMEQSREDMKHAMMLEITDGKLFYAPIGDNPQEILDIGTGTGIWAIEIGDKFPSAHIRGMDISPIQPVWVPPNVDFLVDDCNNEWLAKDVDFVHFRYTATVLHDMPNVLRQCYKSLKPGGWVELQELLGLLMCDDDTLKPDDPLQIAYKLIDDAFTKFGLNVRVARELEPLLREAGFSTIQCVVKKVPIGVWARDKTLRLIGLYQKMAVADFLGAMAGRPFAALGMPPVEREVVIAHARKSLEDTSIHRYFTYYFWYAQKPGGPASP